MDKIPWHNVPLCMTLCRRRFHMGGFCHIRRKYGGSTHKKCARCAVPQALHVHAGTYQMTGREWVSIYVFLCTKQFWDDSTYTSVIVWSFVRKHYFAVLCVTLREFWSHFFWPDLLMSQVQWILQGVITGTTKILMESPSDSASLWIFQGRKWWK